MNRLTSTVVCIFLVLPLLGWGQVKTRAKVVRKPAPTVRELVPQGKITEAVRLASKTPASVVATIQGLYQVVDTQIADRQITDAEALLANLEKFLDAYDKSAKRSSIARDGLQGRQLRLQGIKLNDAKDYAKAETVLKEALAASKKADDPALEAGIHNNLGVALQSRDKLEEARAEFETAVRLAEAQKNPVRTGSYLFNLGRTHLQMVKLDQALDAFKRAESQFKTADKPNMEARAILMQGVTLGKINAVSPEALKFFDRAQKIFEQNNDQRNAGWALYLMGDHVAYSQKFAEAATFGERAVPFLTASGDKEGLSQCYELLLDMYQKVDNKEMAAKYKKLVQDRGKN